MFYKVDSVRLTLREYFWSTPTLLLPVLILAKLLHIRLPLPAAIPDSSAPFLVDPTAIPEDVRAKVHPLEEQMRDCGFSDPAYHWICDPYSSRRICVVTFRHQSGTSLGQIRFCQIGTRKPPKEILTPSFLTSYRDGTFFVSTAGRPELLGPPVVKTQRLVGASVSELWKTHNQQGSLESFGKTIVTAHSQTEMLELVQKAETIGLDFLIQRRVLVPRDETEQKTIEAVMMTPNTETDQAFAAVYGEIERLANRKASWASAILTLLVTVALFFALGWGDGGWKPLLLIAGILFFHESGHLVTMWLFRYRNLRMFFIPFFGAAVTGQNYNVPGWKKALVSLMGPLPGILLGGLLGLVAVICHWPSVMWAAIFLVIINTFNLLPLMPLDGGHVMHAVIFSRHPMLDVGFRIIAALLLIAGGLIGGRLLMFIGISMLVGMPTVYRVGKVVRLLRRRGFDATSHDAQTIPVETARLIHDELRQVLPTSPNAKTSAQLTLQVFESLNASPPGWLASLGLLGVYGLSFFVAGGILMAATLARHNGFQVRQPEHAVECAQTLTWEGADAPEAAPSAVNTIVAEYATREEAEDAYRDMTAKLPPLAAVTLFGQSLMVTLPADDNVCSRWSNELKGRCRKISIQRADSPIKFSLSCTASSDEAAEQLADEVQLYFAAPTSMRLVPPWSPEQRVSESDRKARRTYRAIEEYLCGDDENEEMNSLGEKLFEAIRRHDKHAIEQIKEEREQLQRKLHTKFFQQLRNEGQQKWDVAVVDAYEKSPMPEYIPSDVENESGDAQIAAMKERQKAIERWAIQFGSRLGQLPLDGETPAAGADRFSVRFGTVVRTGSALHFNVSFERLATGTLALAKWLSQHGCTEMKYDFQLFGQED